MERETVEIVTPIANIPVILKTYLTGGERRAINIPYLQRANLTIGEDGQTKKNIQYTADVDNEVKDAAIIQVVVSVNGKSENILEDILNLQEDDYDFVIAKIDEITAPKKK